MSKDEDHVMTGVYIGVGLVLAAGAGYLAWRYLLDDKTKKKAKRFVADSADHAREYVAEHAGQAKELLADSAGKAKRAVKDAKGRILH